MYKNSESKEIFSKGASNAAVIRTRVFGQNSAGSALGKTETAKSGAEKEAMNREGGAEKESFQGIMNCIV